MILPIRATQELVASKEFRITVGYNSVVNRYTKLNAVVMPNLPTIAHARRALSQSNAESKYKLSKT